MDDNIGNLLYRFKKQLEELRVPKTARILVAVSGGVDSMVLCHLLQESDYKFGVAYVDHNTRAGQSKLDGLFVKEYAEQNGISFHLHQLSNKANSGNFHNQAHKERYQFFDGLDYDTILTAHHYDDQIETVFINFLNGRSVLSIPERNGKILRPLLPFSKSEILGYAAENNIAFNEDSSNNENIYLRNLIRNEILPKIKVNLETEVGTRILSLSKRSAEDRQLLETLIQKSSGLAKTDNQVTLPIINLKLHNPIYLFHLIKDYGYSRDLCRQIFESLDNKGNQFYSASYKCVVGATELILQKVNSSAWEPLAVDLKNLPLSINVGNYRFTIANSSTKSGLMDHNSCVMPRELFKSGKLIVRTWEDGDIIKPFGLGGKHKKLKKIFSDKKLDLFQKASIPIFIHNEDIVWVTSIINSEAYKVTEDSEAYLKIERISIS